MEMGRKMPSLTKKRILVIALGEATLDLIIPWMEEGELPVFKKFFEEGTPENLNHQLP